MQEHVAIADVAADAEADVAGLAHDEAFLDAVGGGGVPRLLNQTAHQAFRLAAEAEQAGPRQLPAAPAQPLDTQ